MTTIQKLTQNLSNCPKVWLVTGSAGFIGSNLIEALLHLDQRVIGLDNYSTGSQRNLKEVRDLVGPKKWKHFRQIDGDVRDLATCKDACEGVDFVLHHAALGSVPRSLASPDVSHDNNVNGFLNMLLAVRDRGVKRFVFASSSSVYGDHPGLPKREDLIGQTLSPYALTKRVNELYADTFARCYAIQAIGLRYFNVFGPRQDPAGAYAAVIPKWVAAMARNEPIYINGDGETSRDFCYVANVVQANLLGAMVQEPQALNTIYNVGASIRTTLNELFALLRQILAKRFPYLMDCRPVYQDFRPGDIRHSEADISKASRLLGYEPTHSVQRGLAEALAWYQEHLVTPRSTRMPPQQTVTNPPLSVEPCRLASSPVN
jgi:UDP-N-acetylglucosamine 4-epimerase